MAALKRSNTGFAGMGEGRSGVIPLLLPSYIQAPEPSDFCRWLGTSSQIEVSWEGLTAGISAEIRDKETKQAEYKK